MARMQNNKTNVYTIHKILTQSGYFQSKSLELMEKPNQNKSREQTQNSKPNWP